MAESGQGSSLRLDPQALPVRYRAHDDGADGHIREIELRRDAVVVRRTVRGISMRISVFIAEFLGVSMRLLPPTHGEPACIAVLLEHRDSGLTVPLYLASEDQEAIAEWRSWSRVLGVPPLVLDDNGVLREPFPRLGRLPVGATQPRRKRRATLRQRRPSILLRRKPGRTTAASQVHHDEREIIARS